MKIAVVTDDGQTVSQHFGRAAHYLVFTVEDGAITGTELRDKAGHRQFAAEGHHDHDHEHGHDHQHGQGHGFGPGPDRKHKRMIESITDCEAVLVRGMGRGAYLAMESAKIKPIVTDIPTAEDAVKAFISGDIVDHTEKLH
ncbi:MAG: dinitrogenase iron-molybdenum cofactor biosynthesis protein [Chloroflexi bacterium]|nr:dinitrogenase iron-molybdenum cofactor biosynthesis protein [Chloroflexota bacterium]